MIANDSVNLKDLWTEKTNLLSSILNERVKGALVRSRFLTVRDMDAPTSFFFNLERKKGQEKLMYCLKDCDGRDTSDQTEMRKNCCGFLFQSICF